MKRADTDQPSYFPHYYSENYEGRNSWKKWKITLLIEAISLFVFVSIIFLIPKKYFSKKLSFKQHFEGVEKIKQMKKIKINNRSKKPSSKKKYIMFLIIIKKMRMVLMILIIIWINMLILIN